jgi:hypothetical protein
VGTFTKGHLGPQPINEPLRVATPGAHFARGLNIDHYAAHGFADDHANDMATVALFSRG